RESQKKSEPERDQGVKTGEGSEKAEGDSQRESGGDLLGRVFLPHEVENELTPPPVKDLHREKWSNPRSPTATRRRPSVQKTPLLDTVFPISAIGVRVLRAARRIDSAFFRG